MLTGRKLVFVGGDARMVEVIAQATELDASATLIGLDGMARTFTDTVSVPLSETAFQEADAVVLPIAGMDDAGLVESQFVPSPIALSETHFAAMRPGALVFTGIARPWLAELCRRHHLRLVRLMELDEVAILNSIPTAEGAIAMAMEHTDITIHQSQSVILGFGRCGQTLARTLAALGAKVDVVARNPAQLARIREMALTPHPVSELAQSVAKADIVFNTVPELLLSASVLSGMQKDSVIVDIASKPGGTDFRYTERHGMKAFLAPSLPGSVAPRTAGRIIADSLCRILAESTAGREE